ncbi:hypothetical protein N5F23_21930 [Pseudomonas sichuanensis]|nr:hypothetical protein [Pseudomonas sichuanensis]MDH0731618.1 hypothetical protein [Pseudomonas sichuanensis]MDH1585251.1 hypothetical protein [Pseudomonas sichuanensis]MDH1592665.1 hypothetical protein [Pseudomonas sichuanensis]MDH1598815.1 hypothetical protein [Pseudomonas sichuanensis]
MSAIANLTAECQKHNLVSDICAFIEQFHHVSMSQRAKKRPVP